jgi:cytochrome c oxidase subunit II
VIIDNLPLRRRCRRRDQLAAWSGLLVLGLVLSACEPARALGGTPNALAPRGPAAAEIALLWWIMFGLGTLVFIGVIGLMLYVVAQRQADTAQEVRSYAPDLAGPNAHNWLWWGGVIIPSLILAITLFFTTRTTLALEDPGESEVRIEVIGHRWWWEVRYPGQNFITANEIHIPVGQPVQLELSSADVIHSFWVPELHGKMDLTPGETTTFWLQADEPGVYRGICAEFCGLQHARMHLIVVADPVPDFEAWLEAQAQPATPPEGAALIAGQEVFLNSSCVFCHTIRGTHATGRLGPDLTHLASRLTLASAIVPNNRGNLAGWILDPQHLKPGSLMPPTALSSEELQVLLDYLESLR